MSDNQPEKPKKNKTYILSEKEYVKAKRDRERLKKIKPLAEQIHQITKQLK